MACGSVGPRCTLAQDFVIRGATVHTASTQGTLKNTDVVVRGGVIVAIGSGAGSSTPVIDASAEDLTPRLFVVLTDVGLEEIARHAHVHHSSVNVEGAEWDHE